MILSLSGQTVVVIIIIRYLIRRLFVFSVALAYLFFLFPIELNLNVVVSEDRAICAANINGFLRLRHLEHLHFGMNREKEGLWVVDPPSFEIGRGPRVHREAAEDMTCIGCGLHQG